jgi:hypothetical protein
MVFWSLLLHVDPVLALVAFYWRRIRMLFFCVSQHGLTDTLSYSSTFLRFSIVGCRFLRLNQEMRTSRTRLHASLRVFIALRKRGVFTGLPGQGVQWVRKVPAGRCGLIGSCLFALSAAFVSHNCSTRHTANPQFLRFVKRANEDAISERTWSIMTHRQGIHRWVSAT